MKHSLYPSFFISDICININNKRSLSAAKYLLYKYFIEVNIFDICRECVRSTNSCVLRMQRWTGGCPLLLELTSLSNALAHLDWDLQHGYADACGWWSYPQIYNHSPANGWGMHVWIHSLTFWPEPQDDKVSRTDKSLVSYPTIKKYPQNGARSNND